MVDICFYIYKQNPSLASDLVELPLRLLAPPTEIVVLSSVDDVSDNTV